MRVLEKMRLVVHSLENYLFVIADCETSSPVSFPERSEGWILVQRSDEVRKIQSKRAKRNI